MSDTPEEELTQEQIDCDPNTDTDDLNHRYDAEDNEEPATGDD